MLTARKPILLYSTNTWLAFAIAERYYGGEHFAWCSPHFDPAAVPAVTYAIPPSSSPIEIYRDLRRSVMLGDRHSPKIGENKAGIIKGVRAKLAAAAITEIVAEEIFGVVAASDIRDFRPMVYVIPFHLVQNRVEDVPVGLRAHPMSAEYIIKNLTQEFFDPIGVDGI